MSVKQPRNFNIPFARDADADTINVIPDVPNPNDIAIKPSLAAYSTGYPKRSMTDPAAGGEPFYGQDVNGVLNDITTNLQYIQAGNYYPFNADFQKAVGGYNKFAVVLNPADGKLYQSLVDNNNAALSDTNSWFPFTDGKYLPLTGGVISGRLRVKSDLDVEKSVSMRETNQFSTVGVFMEGNTVATDPFKGYTIRTFNQNLEIDVTQNGNLAQNVSTYTPSNNTWDFNVATLTQLKNKILTTADFGSDVSKGAESGYLNLPNNLILQWASNQFHGQNKWPKPFKTWVVAATSFGVLSGQENGDFNFFYDLVNFNTTSATNVVKINIIAIGDR